MISNSGTTSLGLYDFKRQIDAFGGVDYFRPTLAGGYLPNARVMLNNGEIVQNVTNGNLTNDPNVDMTGWVNIGNTGEVESIAELIAITSPKNGGRVFVKSYHSGIGKGGGAFIYDSSRALENDGGVCLNGWVRQLENNVLNPFMFGAYGDFIPKAQEVIERQSGHNDAVAFQKMYNMNKYTVFTNISKLPPANKAEYTFEWANQMFYIEDTLPVRSYQFTDCNGGKIFFNPIGPKDLFTTPRQEMIDAYTQNTGWNTQTISFVTFKDGCIVGNVTRTSTVHAQRCFDAANAYKWVWDNILIERFALGIGIYPLDTSSWTGGERIGNFYENELRNVTMHECITGFFNGGNATHCSNLTIGGGYVVGKNYTNKFGYLLENHGAGFSCTGFNIAPAHRQNGLPLIYDKCWGSSYTGGYTEWFDTLFDLELQKRFGGFNFQGCHIFKEATDIIANFKNSFSSFDYSTWVRNYLPALSNNQYLNTTGVNIGAKTELITNFFKFCPQYDFKYGLYGVKADDGLTFDVKRYESDWTGFTSKYGLRVLNFSGASKKLRFPIDSKVCGAQVAILYRNIRGFSSPQIKLNILESNGTNARITVAEDVFDYGNGWKLAVVKNMNELNNGGSLQIDINVDDQFEIEHIGAYSLDGYPFMPTYADYKPSVNSGYDRLYDDTTSGALCDIADVTSPFVRIVGGALHASSKGVRACIESGALYPDIVVSTDTTVTTANQTILFETSSTALKNVGIGAILSIQQSGVMDLHRIVGRNYSAGGYFTRNLKTGLGLTTSRSISAGNCLFYGSFNMQGSAYVNIV